MLYSAAFVCRDSAGTPSPARLSPGSALHAPLANTQPAVIQSCLSPAPLAWIATAYSRPHPPASAERDDVVGQVARAHPGGLTRRWAWVGTLELSPYRSASRNPPPAVAVARFAPRAGAREKPNGTARVPACLPMPIDA